ncbi:uncharacterized protein N7469_009715 [Penicillium citrinum]|uniref:Uncharacterized protein n=1 Tax=Penicillium citrinum TaxID=5077 RepID=A0A9W9NJC0_PENCI|nr:uncharacterized protein N7469_009715 [Penicillium citrinum]KAJ5220828.1 hypothetical protein N7469_009715 [Penicillium citrinum]
MLPSLAQLILHANQLCRHQELERQGVFGDRKKLLADTSRDSEDRFRFVQLWENGRPWKSAILHQQHSANLQAASKSGWFQGRFAIPFRICYGSAQ